MSRVKARMARRRSSYNRVTLIVLVVFIIAAVSTAVVALFWVRNFFASQASTNNNTGRLAGNSQESNPLQNIDKNVHVPSGPLQSNSGPTPAPWDGSSRITILVMGLDYRDWEENEIPRTDTMILFSVDPSTKTAGMISIPRDTWVNVPGVGFSKINSAYRWGELYQLPGGGPGLAMQTVEQLLDVPVHFYAQVDFMAFVRFIDILGGLKMHIREEITVDPIGPGNTRTLETGVQTLDGATVLAYARMRYTEGGDFDRSERQQEVILAMRDQLLSLKQLPRLIERAPSLYHELSSGLRTNLSLDQIRRLALLAGQIEEHNIRRGIIGPPLQVELTTSYDGQAVLVPVPDQILILRDEVFSTVANAAPLPTNTIRPVDTPTPFVGDPIELMRAEKASVVVKNGTTTSGLASKTGEKLLDEGINVIAEDNADKHYDSTTIYDYTGKTFTIEFLKSMFNVSQSRVIRRYDPGAQIDIEIILGQDWAEQQ
jgi:polyisoprenyl-teichoic acid--peptidoglycan teichoic acid transferase